MSILGVINKGKVKSREKFWGKKHSSVNNSEISVGYSSGSIHKVANNMGMVL